MNQYPEEDLLPISALQHLAFCERQCALIHVEGIWEESRLTAEGRRLHERVHENNSEARAYLRVARGLRLRSLCLGLVGIADVVEFYRMEEADAKHASLEGVVLPNASGLWRPAPVEYKRGRPKQDNCDKIQLCAQAICLEEMLNVTIREGALFYGMPRRREEVLFSPDLRKETESLAIRLHALVNSGNTPEAQYGKKCENCSLISACLPKKTSRHGSVSDYILQNLPLLENENQ